MPWGFNNMNNNQNNNSMWQNNQQGYGQYYNNNNMMRYNNQYQQMPDYRNNQMGFMFGNNMQNNQMGAYNMQNPNTQMQNSIGQLGNKKQMSPITFEPLDEKTLNEIKAGLEKSKAEGIEKKNTVSKEQNNKFSFSNENNNKTLDDLSVFIQNERNSSLFYKYLSDICIKDSHKNILQNISQDSLRQSYQFNELYKSMSGNEYAIKETTINNTIAFNNGIYLAIEEESKALDNLADIFNSINDEKSINKITSLIYKKISRLSFLHLIVYRT